MGSIVGARRLVWYDDGKDSVYLTYIAAQLAGHLISRCHVHVDINISVSCT